MGVEQQGRLVQIKTGSDQPQIIPFAVHLIPGFFPALLEKISRFSLLPAERRT
jgi:hypothetical protein